MEQVMIIYVSLQMGDCLEATRPVKMRFIIFIIISLLLTPLTQAESTFFDQDDAFIMGESPTGGVIGETISGGGCRYEWDCTNWSECLSSEKQTRTCTNTGTCPNAYKSPEIIQNCTTVPEQKKENKELEEENITEKEEEKEGTDEISTNWNYLLFITIVALFCVGCIVIFRFRKKIKSLMNGLGREYDNNSVRGLINKEV